MKLAKRVTLATGTNHLGHAMKLVYQPAGNVIAGSGVTSVNESWGVTFPGGGRFYSSIVDASNDFERCGGKVASTQQ